jgi:hypothetical protein
MSYLITLFMKIFFFLVEIKSWKQKTWQTTMPNNLACMSQKSGRYPCKCFFGLSQWHLVTWTFVLGRKGKIRNFQALVLTNPCLLASAIIRIIFYLFPSAWSVMARLTILTIKTGYTFCAWSSGKASEPELQKPEAIGESKVLLYLFGALSKNNQIGGSIFNGKKGLKIPVENWLLFPTNFDPPPIDDLS